MFSLIYYNYLFLSWAANYFSCIDNKTYLLLFEWFVSSSSSFQPWEVRCWKQNPVTLTKSSLHPVGERPTLRDQCSILRSACPLLLQIAHNQGYGAHFGSTDFIISDFITFITQGINKLFMIAYCCVILKWLTYKLIIYT